MAVSKGKDAVLYYNTGSYGTPTWSAICNVTDVSVSMTKNASDASTRCGDGWVESIPGLRDATVTFTSNFDKSDTEQGVLITSYLTDATVDIYVADGDITASGTYEGFRAVCMVSNMSIDQPLDDVQKINFELRPEATSNGAPEWLQTVTP